MGYTIPGNKSSRLQVYYARISLWGLECKQRNLFYIWKTEQASSYITQAIFCAHERFQLMFVNWYTNLCFVTYFKLGSLHHNITGWNPLWPKKRNRRIHSRRYDFLTQIRSKLNQSALLLSAVHFLGRKVCCLGPLTKSPICVMKIGTDTPTLKTATDGTQEVSK